MGKGPLTRIIKDCLDVVFCRRAKPAFHSSSSSTCSRTEDSERIQVSLSGALSEKIHYYPAPRGNPREGKLLLDYRKNASQHIFRIFLQDT